MTDRQWLAVLFVVVFAGLFVAVTGPAAAQDPGTGEINLTLEPTDGQANPGENLTYDVVVEGPDNGIGAYARVLIEVGDNTVANITTLSETRSTAFSQSEIRDNGSALLLSQALAGRTYGPASELTIATFTAAAVGNVGQSTTLTFNGSVNPAISDQNDSSYNISAFNNATLLIPAPPNFEVSNLTPASPTVTNGTTVDISADITNTGDQQGTQTVTLSVGGVTQTRTVTLAAGANTTATFSLDTGQLGPGTYSHTVASQDDSASGTLQVQQRARFAVSNLTPVAATVTNGTTVDIAADIENTGDVQGTQTVTLTVGPVTRTQSQTLAAGESATATFSVDTGLLGPGSYTHEIASANESETGSLTVEAPPNFQVSNLTPASATVTNGTSIDIAADIQNTGDQSGTQTVTLTVGPVTRTQSLPLPAGASTTVTFADVETGVLGPGAYTHTVSTANDSASGSLTVQARADFQVSNLTPASATVTNGTIVDISADIENVGDVQGTQTVTLTVGSVTRTQSQTLAGGASTTVTFADVDTGALGPGSYTHQIGTANDSASGSLTVQERATFAVSNLTPATATVTNETIVDISADIENTGDVQGTQTVMLTVGSITRTQSITLAAGASTTAAFSVDTGLLGPGAYTHEIGTANESESGSLTVEAPPTFEVSNLTPASATVTNGTSIDIAADIANTGDQQGTQTVILTVGSITRTQSQTLAAGASTTVTFADVDTGALGPGSYTHEIGTANDSETGSLTVEAPPNFQVSNLAPASTTVTNGTIVGISADIQNTGDQQGTQTVTLSVGPATQTQMVTLAGGATSSVTFSLDTGALGPGSYTHQIVSANDSESGSLTVEAPATFEVSTLTPASVTVTEGATVNVSLDVTNVGDQQGTQTIVATLGGTTLGSKSVTLAAGESTTLTPLLDTSQLTPGSYTYEIASANDSASGSLTVEAPANFQVSNLTPATETVTNGTVIDVAADIENTGDQSGTQTVTLSVGGLTRTQSLTLAAGASTTVAFQNIDTGLLGPGSYTQAIGTANDSASGSLTVQAPVNFTVTNLAPASVTVTNGTTVDISADITNTGDVQSTQTVTLTAGGVTQTQSLTLAGSASSSVTFSLATGLLGPGTYSHEIGTANDSAAGTLTVQQPATFAVTDLTPASVTVTNGTIVDISATVTNTGDLQGTRTVTLSVGTSTVPVDYSLAAGANTTASFSVVTGQVGPGSYTYEIASANDSASGSLTVQARADFAVSNLAPASVTATNGTTVDIAADITNTGDVQATQTVTFSAGTVTQSQSLTLAGGASSSVTFSLDTGALGPGAYTTEIGTANDSATGTLTVEAPANFAVSNLAPAATTATNGTIVDISATVTNTGDQQATQTVTLSAGGVTQARSLTLAASAGSSVTFSLDTGTLGPGTYTTEIGTANDSASGSLTVQARADFGVSNLTPASATATNGTVLSIAADIENTGDVQATQTVTLTAGGVTQTQSVTLAGGANTTATFSLDTGLLGPGTYSHEIATANDSAFGTLTVQQPATFAVSNLTPASATVTNGTTVDISADIQNTGDQQGTQTVTLSVGSVTQTQSITLAAGANTTASFSVETGQLGPGTYSHQISSANDSASGTLQVQRPATFDVRNINPVAVTVTSGTTVSVSADIENTGDVQGTQTLTLTVGGVTQTQSQTLAGGASTTVAFSVDTGTLGPGTYTTEIASANASASGTLTVQAPADFQVSTLQPANTTVTAGATVGISADIQNAGDAQGTQTVTLSAGSVTQTQPVTLAGGANTTTTFSVDTGQLGPGTYTTEVASANDSESGTLTVQAPPEFQVSNLQPPSATVTNGTEVDISADIANTGDAQGTQTVTLAVGAVTQTQAVTLAGGAGTTATFSLDTGALGPGNYTPQISTANDSLSGTLTVQERATFAVSNLQPASATVTNGTSVDISADIQNTGDLTGTQTVTLSVGSVTQTQSLTLAAGANATATFALDTGALGPGTYTHEIGTANDSTSGTLAVEPRPTAATFEVSNLQPASATVVNGTELDISADVANVGDLQGTQTVTLSVDGVTQTQMVTLAGGASTTVTFTVDTGALGPGSYTHQIGTANDSESGTLTVQAPPTFEVSNLQPASATVINGTEVDISADIANTGDLTGTQTVTLTVDGITQTESLTLAGGANTTVAFQNVDTGLLGPGTYTHEIGTANDSASGTLTVDPEPTAATFLVTNIQPADAAVVNGTELDISADVRNVGDLQGTQTLTLSAGALARTQNVTLAGGANTTVTFADVDTGALGPGTYTHEIASANDSASGTLTVQQPPTFAVSNLQPASATATNGTTVDISATVANTGDLTGTQTVTLSVGSVTQTQSLTLVAGANTAVMFTVDTGALGPGTYTHTIATANDSATGTLTVQQPPTFAVSNLQPPSATVTNGTSVDISATVANTGDQQGTQTVTLSVGSVRQTESLTLAAGANTTAAFSLATGALGPGSYTHEIGTANDSAAGTLTVQQPATFLVSDITPPAVTVTNGTAVSISADIQNAGDLQGTQTVTLSVDGVTQSQSLTLAAGGSTTVTFTVDTGALGPGSYTHEIATANGSATGSLTVNPEPTEAAFFVRNLDPASATVTAGALLDISADIQNTGDLTGTQTVTLSIDGLAQTQQVTLAGGANTTVTFSVDAGVLGPGTYTTTIATANDSASGTLTVRGQAGVELRPTSDSVRITETTTVEVAVTGAAGGVGAYDITVDLNDTAASVVDYDLLQTNLADNSSIGPDNATVSLDATLGTPVQTSSAVIAELTLRFDTAGTVGLSAADPRLDSASGVAYNTTSTGAVVSTFGPPPIVAGRLPQDPNGDGLYENVRGTGGFNILDVQALFNNLGTPALQDNAGFFVFGGVDQTQVTVIDVQALFNRLGAPTQPGRFEVSNLDPATATAVAGERIDISADIENTAGVEGTQSVELTAGSVTRTQTVTLAAGGVTTVSFSVDTGALGPGTYSHAVGTANDSASGTLQVQQPATFGVSMLDPATATVPAGTSLDIAANLTNTGDVQGTQTVTLTVGGVSATRSVTLAAGGSTTVTFAGLNTGALGPGTYTHTISTADDSVNGTLTVEPETEFQVSDLDPATATVSTGTTVDISATVENAGPVQGTQTVTLAAGSVSATQNVTLAGGANTTVTFALDTGTLGPGTYTHTVSTANDSASGTLTVTGKTDFQVSNLDPASATVTRGDTLSLSAIVENAGTAAGTANVTLAIGGTTVETQSVPLADGDFQVVGFDAPTDSLAAGTYAYTVSTANDSATGTLTVLQPGAFQVSDLTPQTATVSAGDQINISATITNTGASEVTQAVTLTVDGLTQSRVVTLAGGANETVAFQNVDTAVLGPGEYSHTIATGNDSASGTLTVKGQTAVELRQTGEVRVGTETTVQVVVTGATDGVSAYEVLVDLNSSVASVVDYDLAGTGVLDNSSISVDNTTVSLDATVGNALAGPDVVLANLTLRFDATGSVQLSATNATIRNANGTAYDSTQTGTVVSTTGPPPVLVNPPQDLNGNGLYEDIRGDGRLDVLDVQTLFNNLDNPAVQNNVEFFKFSGLDREEVSVLDVQALFNRA